MSIPVKIHLEKKSTPVQPHLEKKVDLFLSLAKIKRKRAEAKLKILEHVNADIGLHNYVLFRHASLYFFNADTIKYIEKTKDDYAGEHYLRFDGEKVSRIDPEYYLGSLSKHREDNQATIGTLYYELGSNNNNNNNNGNNGNNG